MFATIKHEASKVRQVYWMTRFSHTGKMIQRAIEKGEIAPETDPNAVLTALTGALYVRMLVLDAPLDELFLDQLARIVLEGVMMHSREGSAAGAFPFFASSVRWRTWLGLPQPCKKRKRTPSQPFRR
jgi:Tetracyclin repressor-like, C-terminal domain